MQNLEIKWELSTHRFLKKHLRAHSEITFQYQHFQRDVYFRVPSGRMKIRLEENCPPVLIRYNRPNESDVRISTYRILTIHNLNATLLKLQKKFGILAQVEKWREVYFFRNVRIHLDNVRQLGWFLELESVIGDHCPLAQAQVNLNIMLDYLKPFVHRVHSGSYVDLILAYRSRFE